MELYEMLCQEDNLMEGWRKVRKKNASGGLEGIIPSDLDNDIDGVIKSLSSDLSDGIYVPAPYREIQVPKFNEAGEWRHLSMPLIKDKIVQQAAVNLISPIFESLFLDSSYAYRARKGPGKAIRRIEHLLRQFRPGYALACDIDNFFDTIDHDRLIAGMRPRVQDDRILSLIRLWVKSGYINQKGKFSEPEEGIAQGAVISPLLSNIYLHELDAFTHEKGYLYIRYSDNFIIFTSDSEKGHACYNEVKAFLENNLSLRLNKDAAPVRDIIDGFTFLGIQFKGKERAMAAEKQTKTIKKLTWLTESVAGQQPNILIERLNKKIISQKRFYSFIKPVKQFTLFDEHLKERLFQLINHFLKQGIFSTRTELERFLIKVEYYNPLNEREKKAIVKDIASKALAKSKPSNGQGGEGALKIESNEAKIAKRVNAQRNRYLKVVNDEAEVSISSHGVFIGKNSRRLVVRQNRKNICEHPFAKIRHITVSGNGVTLSSDLVKSCALSRIPLVFLNNHGAAYAMLHSPLHGMGDLSLLQTKLYGTEKSLYISKRIITGKCRNQMNVLKFYSRHRSRTDHEFYDRVRESMTDMEKNLSGIHDEKADGDFDAKKNRIFLLEARISSDYWGMVKMLLPPELGFIKREKQGAENVVNCMLNYGYGILTQRVYCAILMAGLNPNISFLHSFHNNKPTLVYDVMEEFRQTLVDKPLFSLMTKGSRYKGLAIDKNSGLLNNTTRELTLKTILNRLSTLISFRGKKVQAEDIITAQVRALAAFIRGKSKNYRPFISTY
jgi:group II intron reverse transcriptase/maturase/CRISPR-associated endonuclease Cas1